LAQEDLNWISPQIVARAKGPRLISETPCGGRFEILGGRLDLGASGEGGTKKKIGNSPPPPLRRSGRKITSKTISFGGNGGNPAPLNQ